MKKNSSKTQTASAESDSGSFNAHVHEVLEQSVAEVQEYVQGNLDSQALDLLKNARDKAEKFAPTPQIIWRLANFVLGRADKINQLSEGMVFGLKRIILAVAHDGILGAGEQVLTVRKALQVVPSDTIAAAAITHAIYRRLQKFPHQTVWGPIFDDALMRSQIGFYVGRMCPEFGAGRGMLAGLSGRLGLAVLIALGDRSQAHAALSELSSGKSIAEVALEHYDCDPIQVAAMVLSAAGCGREAVVGVSAYSILPADNKQLSKYEDYWFQAVSMIELIRLDNIKDVSAHSWKTLGFESTEDQGELDKIAKITKRRGHGWQWLL